MLFPLWAVSKTSQPGQGWCPHPTAGQLMGATSALFLIPPTNWKWVIEQGRAQATSVLIGRRSGKRELSQCLVVLQYPQLTLCQICDGCRFSGFIVGFVGKTELGIWSRLSDLLGSWCKSQGLSYSCSNRDKKFPNKSENRSVGRWRGRK